MDPLPTFYSNQKVLCTPRQTEACCPACGSRMEFKDKKPFEATILGPALGLFHCADCDHYWPIPEGYWAVNRCDHKGKTLCVPYPLIREVNG